jgi:hypothetical protein
MITYKISYSDNFGYVHLVTFYLILALNGTGQSFSEWGYGWLITDKHEECYQDCTVACPSIYSI